MVRGTTTTIEFTIPYETNLITDGWASFGQGGAVIVDKQMSDCTMSGKKVTVNLTQTETLKMMPGEVNIQLRLKMSDGSVLASEIKTDTVEDIIRNGVI